MTLAMPDSITVDNLPPGYDAYLGYVDGQWPTAAALAVKFPGAELVRLTVTGTTLDADGCDIETGDLTPVDGGRWARDKLVASPGSRPVLYASVENMLPVMVNLGVWAIPVASVRLLSAHYGQGAHICGPASCGEIGIEMDGTQWTDEFAFAPGGGETIAHIDMSMLAGDFFTGSTGLNQTERIVNELGIVQAGYIGAPVKTVQGLCNARLPVAELGIDGVFGPRTAAAVKSLQAEAGITADGVVGPKTWPVLLGVA